MTDVRTTMQLRVNAISFEAVGIHSFELVDPSGRELPVFTAGAHIDIDLPNGLSRSYSLINPQGERHRYVVAVSHDRAGRGGSRHLHEHVRVGDTLPILSPRNNFYLHEESDETVLIAGGIGITPLWGMIQRLEEIKRNWTLHYCVRTRAQAAFYQKLHILEQAKPGRVHFNFDHEPGGTMLDIAALLRNVPVNSHIYCCGPIAMLAAFETAAADRTPDFVHVEYFSPKVFDGPTEGFSVVLARAGKTLTVPPEKSILDVLLENGVKAPFSCKEGVCGTCEVNLLSGVPDHRDSVLSEQERESHRTMIICCSRAESESLTIDL